MYTAERLRKLSKVRKYRLDYISKLTGISKATLSKYEYPHTFPSTFKLNKLADFYEASTDY